MRLPKIPRAVDDHSHDAAVRRRRMLGDATGVVFQHIAHYSVDPAETAGNIEHFTGVAQVPIGVAGPLLVHGQHASGEFYVPLATTEGTLVASYNRGMKLLRAAGGVRTTVIDDAMQRAPVFHFDDAREALRFAGWLDEHFDAIAAIAATTTEVGCLRDIQSWVTGRFCFTRFNYTTGDAAGQNMTGKSTWAACNWLLEHAPAVRDCTLEGNFATDKKHSVLNTLHTRGKRVIAEAVVPDQLLRAIMGVSAEQMYRQRRIAKLGAMQAGASNDGAHAANGIAALFLATGQDVANVAESHAGVVHAELDAGGAYCYSITLPSLIVGTYGGGTALPTQRECLKLLGCYGTGRVLKFAEIVAATVLCGELSLGSAIAADEWVSAHDRHGRNR